MCNVPSLPGIDNDRQTGVGGLRTPPASSCPSSARHAEICNDGVKAACLGGQRLLARQSVLRVEARGGQRLDEHARHQLVVINDKDFRTLSGSPCNGQLLDDAGVVSIFIHEPEYEPRSPPFRRLNFHADKSRSLRGQLRIRGPDLSPPAAASGKTLRQDGIEPIRRHAFTTVFNLNDPAVSGDADPDFEQRSRQALVTQLSASEQQVFPLQRALRSRS